MPAGRRILPQSLSIDPRYARLSLKAKVLYPLLWVNADDQGRLSGNPDKLKLQVCASVPEITSEDIPALIEEMARAKNPGDRHGLIIYYNITTAAAIQITDWWDVQRPQWAYPSAYEAPPGWQDRLRYKERPTGPVIKENWEPKFRTHPDQDLKKAILERDNYTCQKCGCTDRRKLDIHHIIPRWEGGSNDPENLITFCTKCHGEEEGKQPPSIPPSLPRGKKEYKNKPNIKQTQYKTKEEGIATASTTEIGIIDNLARLKGWTVDSLEDLIWLREFMADFPDFAPADIKACRDYHSGRAPPKHKGIWKNRLRNWMDKKREFREGRTGGQPRKGVRPKPEQERRRSITRIPGD